MRRLLLLSFLFLPVRLLAQDTLRVERGGSTLVVSGARVRGYRAYPASALEALGADVLVEGGRVRAVLLGDTLRFEALSPFFHVGSSVQQLAEPVYVEGDVAWLPRQLFTEWLPARYPGTVSYDAGVVRARGLLGRRVAEADGAAGAGARPTAAGPTPAPKTGLAPPPPSAAGDRPKANAGASAASAAPSPKRAGAGARPAAGRADALVVVLDAGHGGKDPGRIGPAGVREKDVTLSIVQRLKGLLESRGYEVHLTRTRDTLIALGDRPRMANEWKSGRPAALFVSIHANGGVKSAKGFETYFLSDARTDDERRVAEMENAAEKYEDKPDTAAPELDRILNSLRNDYYVKASDDLAEAVQHRLAGVHPGPNRGVRRAGFRVLVGAFMPAVLVETAFISNPAEEKLLAGSAFQEKLAWAVAEAVDGFFDSHELLWNAGGAN